MKQPKNTPLLRCPAGYLISLENEEKINETNMNQQSKNRNQLKKDRLTGFLFVLMFALALLVSLV